MEIKKIAVCDHVIKPFFGERHLQRIRETVPQAEVIYAKNMKELLAQTNDADVLIAMPFVTPELLNFCKNAPSLKWFHSLITGVDELMGSDIARLNIKISATRGIHRFSVGDHVLAFIFGFLRALPASIQAQMRHEYSVKIYSMCDDSYNKTVGIIGLGNIGMHIAKRCKLLEMRVLGLKRTPIQSEWLDTCYGPEGLDELLKESDFVVLTVPLTPETKDMIGEREFGLMKKTAYLINVARGAVVNEEALIKAMREGMIAGAGLDAFVQEPLPADSPLWDLPNVVITPHSGGQTPYYMDRAMEIITENLVRFLKDEELLYEVSRERGY